MQMLTLATGANKKKGVNFEVAPASGAEGGFLS